MDVESEKEGRDIGGHSGFWLEKWECEGKQYHLVFHEADPDTHALKVISPFS